MNIVTLDRQRDENQLVDDGSDEVRETSAPLPPKEKISVRNLTVCYGGKSAVSDITLSILEHRVTALIGPSGCGKSTFLRSLNRMNDVVIGATVTGEIHLGGENIYDRSTDVIDLRRRVGMVFQKSNPFPKSIFENVAFGLRINGIKDKKLIQERVQESLQGAALWDVVKDRLNESALALSGGEQQRLCIARALAVRPEVLLMDEPASALDPIATNKIEELIHQLKKRYTIVIVTHNMQQAARVSDYTAFFYLGKLVEIDHTETIFTNPSNKLTEEYVTGRFG